MVACHSSWLKCGFGVLNEEDYTAYRGTFVANPEGIVKVLEVNDGPIGRNAAELVRKIEAAQFVAEHKDEVCPAKWEKGKETLKPSIDLVEIGRASCRERV